ncbi:LytR family transcriptional attenuator [Antricoccus suffuscus]|uniref:LytR family transcriptional attenuator n=1 Tax=Antricoccus suffuscus TaxID=1629062 RepID=A0A2T0ZB51_9ACTN|nr:LCP family protein [Antricoccus suffuscus]PRZ33580.1 LytR family transcriptional attenuator [Antricoccus suffuscus]
MPEPTLPPELDPRRRPAVRPRANTGNRARSRADRNKRKRYAVLVARTLATVISVALLVGAGFVHSSINRFNAHAGTLPGTSDVAGNKDAKGVNGADMNILVIGDDSRDGYTQAQLAELSTQANPGNNTDTLMLIHVPANGTAASVVSFPRDSYVSIPGYGKSKINSAYADGYNDAPQSSTPAQRQAAGQALLISTISQLSGVKVDHVVTVSLLGFYNLTNQLGGVEVNLCQAAKDSYSGIDLSAGKHLLMGKEALSFVRQRHGLPNGDLDRVKRQQYFFGATIRKLLGQNLLDVLNISKLNNLIDALAGTINYDKGLNPLDLAAQMRDIAAGNVKFQTIPLAAQPFVTKPGVGDVVMPVGQSEMYSFFQGLSAATTAPAPSSTSSAAAPSASGSAAPTTAAGSGSAAPPTQATTAANTGCVN